MLLSRDSCLKRSFGVLGSFVKLCKNTVLPTNIVARLKNRRIFKDSALQNFLSKVVQRLRGLCRPQRKNFNHTTLLLNKLLKAKNCCPLIIFVYPNLR